MFELICIINLFINAFLILKLNKKEQEVEEVNLISSEVDKKVNNTSGIFNRLYGRF
jgi:hypothetical protein